MSCGSIDSTGRFRASSQIPHADAKLLGEGGFARSRNVRTAKGAGAKRKVRVLSINRKRGNAPMRGKRYAAERRDSSPAQRPRRNIS